MHVLVINIFFAPYSYGGATIVAEEVALSLVEDFGHQVTVISAISRVDLPAYATLTCEDRGIRNILINLPGGRSYAEHYANPQVAERVASIARDLEPDIAHLHCLQDIGSDCIAALKSQGIPVVLSTHDFWWLCERQFMIRGNRRYCGQDPVRITGCRGCVDSFDRAQTRFGQLRMMGAMADLVTAPSVFARDLHARSGFAKDRMTVWRNGVRAPSVGFAAAQAARRAADPRLVFGFVGGPSQIKGWPLLRKAFADLRQGSHSGLLVDGSLDGSWWAGKDLSALSGDWNVHPRYDQKDMDGFFAKIDVLLFLSQWKETFGLTIREAFCRGVRVIQTESGGTMEHDRQDATRVLPIGCPPEQLRQVIQQELDRPMRGCDPRPERGFREQARGFLDLVEPILMDDRARMGAA